MKIAFSKFIAGLETVEKDSNGCWLWTANVDNRGYGRISVNRRYRSAHRISWEWFRGCIPKGLFVCHKCDTPRCVNPDHLFIGTPKDNMVDMVRKGRGKTHWVSGHALNTGERNGRAKLSRRDVSNIRRLYAGGAIKQKELAKLYGVCPSTISMAVTGYRWSGQ